ncbi:MAG TPA: FkbM family methyltransferase [Ignavibacteriaceae bacterium]
MQKLIQKIFTSPELINKPPVLIDIGASGQLHKKWKLIAKHSICIAFDADEREFGFIEKKQSNFKKLFIYNCIVSDKDSSDQIFYLTKSPYCSSILKPDFKNLANYSFADIFKIVDTSKLKTVSISTALRELDINQVDWFKTDSQGLDLRLFKNLRDEIRQKIIIAEFEPGLIDAYEYEDKLYSLLGYIQNKNYWISDFIVKGNPRISADLFNTIYLNKKLNKLLALSLKPAPGWVEMTIINSFDDKNSFSKREYILGCLFAIIEEQYGFAYELSIKGLEKFNDPIFDEIKRKSLKKVHLQLYKLKFLPLVINRIKELISR